MNRRFCILLVLILCWSLCACDAGEAIPMEPDATLMSTEPWEPYGALQTIVDDYGFPIHFRMTEGMELTQVVISEDSARREWMSSLDGSSLHENLTWSITDDQLTVSGEWEDVFTIDIGAGRAVSQADGKEYRIVTYDDAGEVEFHVD